MRMTVQEFEDRMAVLIGRLAKEYDKSNVEYTFQEWHTILQETLRSPAKLPDDIQ